ncbi:hypothetical protein [Streptomyces sp. NPDC098781]|uniref:hypothetical protein n=1 Tax=Streptomyces sp. NPDC098781 TaxID=3366097 RepID=UPI003823F260
MRAFRRVTLLVAPGLLALTSCGIPATGVVEAGGPASGIRSITPLYFVQDGGLVAVDRPTERPGDPAEALELLLNGPQPGEASKGVKTELPGPVVAAVRPDTPFNVEITPTVSVTGDTVVVELPSYARELSGLARAQLTCTAAAAYRISTPSAGRVTVEVTDGAGRRAEGTDDRCPER